jgi:phosphate transport system substrate-binding protein
MKKTVLVSILLFGAIVGSEAQRIKGSDTVLPLSQKGAESYMKANPSATVMITGGGSGVGLSALIAGSTDIAQSSRKIKFNEKQKMQNAGKTAVEIIIAHDALAIVVNPANKVTRLTREQLEGIFTGKIRNWKEVGGDDMRIIPYARETSSGTYEFFRESVLNNKNYMSGIMSLPATGAIIQSIRQTRGAIAYVGFAYLNSHVKAIHVSYDGGKTYTEPTVDNAQSGNYPIVRPMYYYYEAGSEAVVKPFIDYIFSPAGHNLVTSLGYITMR